MESIKDVLFRNPLLLEDIPDVNEVSEFYLPYSTGFEIECDKGGGFNLSKFTSIPDIIDVNICSSEQRFRIPSGFKGFKCLFNISETLKKYSIPNDGSGIHYHVDFTDTYHDLTSEFIEANESWILGYLSSWRYKGSYNRKGVTFDMGHCWVRFQSSFKTMEIRIGEMTFDYELLIQRITDANYIAKVLKENIELYKQGKNLINVSNKEIYGDINKTIDNRKIIL